MEPNDEYVENQDEEAEEDLELDGDEYEEGTEDDDPIATQVQQMLDEEMERLAAEIAEGKADNKVYKGLQRHISKRDQEVAQYRQALEQQSQQVQALAQQLEQANAGMEWLSSEVYNALSPEDQEKFSTRLTQAQLRMMQEQGNRNPPPNQGGAAQPQHSNEEREAWIRQKFEEAEATFKEKANRLVKSYGLDPDDSRLNYGPPIAPDVTFFDKMDALVDSIETVKEKDAKVNKAKKKSPSTNTRGGGIEGKSPSNSRTNRTNAGASALLSKIEKLDKEAGGRAVRNK